MNISMVQSPMAGTLTAQMLTGEVTQKNIEALRLVQDTLIRGTKNLKGCLTCFAVTTKAQA